MPDYSILTQLLDLPHLQVTHYQLVGPDRLNLSVESDVPAAVCPDCQQISVSRHDTAEPHMIRDLPIWNRRCWLRYAPRRFKCTTCGDTFVERVPWREPGAAYTGRYEQFVYQRTRREPVLQIARDERLTEDIVQGIFERQAKKSRRTRLPPRENALSG